MPQEEKIQQRSQRDAVLQSGTASSHLDQSKLTSTQNTQAAGSSRRAQQNLQPSQLSEGRDQSKVSKSPSIAQTSEASSIPTSPSTTSAKGSLITSTATTTTPTTTTTSTTTTTTTTTPKPEPKCATKDIPVNPANVNVFTGYKTIIENYDPTAIYRVCIKAYNWKGTDKEHSDEECQLRRERAYFEKEYFQMCPQ